MNVLGFVLLAIGMGVIIDDVKKHIKMWRKEDAEDEEEEQRRSRRQRIFERHARELARFCLMRDFDKIRFAGERLD